MKNYKVIAGAVPALHDRKIVTLGDILPADFFKDGEADELCKARFIEETEDNATIVAAIRITLTADDMERNPDLEEEGLKVGDEIDLPYEGYVPAPVKKGKNK
jgi:hypothetical protein